MRRSENRKQDYFFFYALALCILWSFKCTYTATQKSYGSLSEASSNFP